MLLKFIPYQPTISDSGRKIDVTTVKNFISSFWRMSICACYASRTWVR